MKAFGNIAKDSEIRAVASGSLTNGASVIVNADNTVSVVAETSFSETLGSDVTFNAASTSWVANAFDSTNNKVVVAYKDNGNSGYGHARVGTVDSSDNSISWGTEVTFRSSEVQYISACFDSANGKIVIAYQDFGDSQKGKAIVGTVSGTDISFGSSVEFQSGETTWINAVYDISASKVVIVYRNSGGDGKAIVGTVSGTSISFGSIASTGHGALQGSAVYHAAAERIVAAGKINNSTASSAVGAVSGTSISFGSAVAYGTSSAQKNNNKIAYDSASEKVVVFYRDEGVSGYGRASVGTVDASDNSIAFATAVTVTTDSVDMVGVQGFSSGGQIIFLYSDTTNTKGDLKVGTISGTTLSVGSELNVRDGGNTNYWGLCEDTTNDRLVIAYEGASSHGISNVYNPAFSVTNITSENFIGFLDGKSKSISESIGSATVFNTANSENIASAYDSTNSKVVVFSKDGGSPDNLEAVVGTVSNGSISFGSAAEFHAGGGEYIAAAFDSSNGKFLVVYKKTSDNYLYSKVGTVSGTSISFGSEAAVDTTGSTGGSTVTFDSTNNKIVVSYTVGSFGYAKVGTISGTSISYGSRATFESASIGAIDSTFDTDNGKVVIAYSDQGNSTYGTAVIGTVSGTSISFGTPVVFESAATDPSINYIGSSKVFIGSKVGGGTGTRDGKGIVGTVSGTSISFGSAVVFESDDVRFVSSVYHSAADKVIVFYQDNGNSDYGSYVIGTISGTSVSFTSSAVFESAKVSYVSSVYDSNDERAVAFYRDEGDSSKGTSITYRPSFTKSTTVLDGVSTSIKTANSISRSQSGLTAGQTYFVQTDGTLGTTAANPSVTAGTAISATELIVKG